MSEDIDTALLGEDSKPDDAGPAAGMPKIGKEQFAGDGEPQDFGSESRYKTIEKKSLTDADRLIFAKHILLGVTLLFAIGMALRAYSETAGPDIFEACKTILPSIATLVIGYYFGQK